MRIRWRHSAGKILYTAFTRAVRKGPKSRSEEHTSELQSQSNLVCRLLLEKKKKNKNKIVSKKVIISQSKVEKCLKLDNTHIIMHVCASSRCYQEPHVDTISDML